MSEENLDPLVTECPNCDTRFRVTESQLQIAGGRVRCGACLVVFDGTAHLSLDGEDFVSGEESEDVDALLDELDEISSREPAQAPTMPNWSDVDFDPVSAADLASGSSAEAQDADADDTGLPPELLALEAQFLAEMQGEPVQPAADEAGTVSSEKDTQPDWDESVADDIWQTEESQTQEPQPEQPMSVPVVDQEIELQSLHEPPPASSPDEVAEADSPVAAGISQSEGVSSHLPDYSDVELELEPDTPDKRTWLTLLLVLLGLVALPAQVLWFQYDAWSMNPQYRPIYETVCRVAGCNLPPLRDITLIDAQKSVIRVHPERPDARVVDVLMINKAEFAQPYPLIELLATNMRGQLIAGRRFKPEEYLRGEVGGGALMPSQTPVHVSLEIQDPGEDALNFEVKFR
ncbi:MAG: DUF3426 domain-containing protein [Pseudomonadaceae bacterium]|nr:DUF3426 domain-containing protein [Pseudomonadaceae bacterium]